MEAAYAVRVDSAHRLVDVTMGGYFSAEDLGWAGEQVRAAIQSLGGDAGRHVTLYDLRGMKVVPPAAVDALCRTITSDAVRAIWARRIAYVVGSALARQQVKRIAALREGTGIFEDRQAALDWLLAG